MKISKLLLFFILIGIFSAITIVYFYFIQRDFTKKHREFLIHINELENSYLDNTSLILKNSIYVYVNQDNIAISNRKLENDYTKLSSSKILFNEDYIDIKDNITFLKEDIKQNLQNIETFLMINATIKNSLLFLSHHVEDAEVLQKNNQNELLRARVILKHFNDAKKLQDLDYIDSSNYLLSSSSTNKNVQKYIQSFNIHSTFLINNYPLFIGVTKKILEDSPIQQKIHNIKQEFSKIALNDFKALDRFAFILFTIFFLSFITIIILLVKYQRENKKLIKTYSSLEYSLTYDRLTKLYNRRKFELDIEVFKNPFLVLINIDDFKNINDIYGNTIGNILLKELSKFLIDKIESFGKSSIYRLGGDEFGIVFNDDNEDRIINIATKLEKDISKYIFKINSIEIEITVSIAINNVKPILENADLTLKNIKKLHNKKVAKYEESQHLKENVEENMQIVQLIKDALLDSRIVPFFQPIINLKTSKIEKYEALVRLKLLDGTFLPPFKFLDIAKKSSQYNEITKVMIEKTINTAKKYPQYRFSINMSMIDISDKKITNILFTMLEENKNCKIDIELLESENLSDITIVKEFIKKLHSFGSYILIDDFGTGYSNFFNFSELDIDIVKIDGSIVKGIIIDERKYHMLKSIKEFANGMNMKTVSEFVENKEIAVKLRDLGATYAQGYYFSTPLEKPLDDDSVVI